MSYAKVNSKGMKQIHLANVHHLNRILFFLKDNPNSRITEIFNGTGITRDRIKTGLLFLVKVGAVELKIGNSGRHDKRYVCRKLNRKKKNENL